MFLQRQIQLAEVPRMDHSMLSGCLDLVVIENISPHLSSIPYPLFMRLKMSQFVHRTIHYFYLHSL